MQALQQYNEPPQESVTGDPPAGKSVNALFQPGESLVERRQKTHYNLRRLSVATESCTLQVYESTDYSHHVVASANKYLENDSIIYCLVQQSINSTSSLSVDEKKLYRPTTGRVCRNTSLLCCVCNTFTERQSCLRPTQKIGCEAQFQGSTSAVTAI